MSTSGHMGGLESETRCTAIRHVQIEDLGYIGEALERNGMRFHYVDAGSLDEGEPGDPDAPLIVLGGPMSAYDMDRHPFLAREIALIRRRLDDGRPVLGICLGAQLMAAAAGARVYPGEAGKEIGWAEVELSDAAAADPLWSGFPKRFTTFHWHGDTFELPPGAEILANSDRYLQVFRLGPRAYGVQFHPEVMPRKLEAWIAAYHLELERENLNSDDVLNVPDEAAHRRLALLFGDNVARVLGA